MMVEGDDAVQPFEVRQLGSLVFVALRQLVGTEPSSLCGFNTVGTPGNSCCFLLLPLQVQGDGRCRGRRRDHLNMRELQELGELKGGR